MKRFVLWLIIAAVTISILSIQFPTMQGVDYVVRSYKIPLYIKIIEFVDRDYHYRRIAQTTTAGKGADFEKVIAILGWCARHIKHQPKELPLVDDHPLNIVIRGYGGQDQLEDIFTILCTYAGYEAFYKAFYNSDGTAYFISFVKIKDVWYPFSAYNNVYPHKNGAIVSVDAMMNDASGMDVFKNSIPSFDPDGFRGTMRKIEFKAQSMRVKGQSPAGRLIYHLKHLFGVVHNR